ncbi:MAG: N-6 DNA methylase [Candidatus Helarchaeota archaeon]|nr:N-6 DNA methylase [Candidatus Helarchaeota archaeon]
MKINNKSPQRSNDKTSSQKLRPIVVELAELTKKVQAQMKLVFNNEDMNGPIHQILKHVKTNLIHDLTRENFPEIFAQTMICALFTIKVIKKGAFSTKDLIESVSNHPSLEYLFRNTLQNPLRNSIGLDKVIEFLTELDSEALLNDHECSNIETDLITRFYDLFLRALNTQQKRRRGVFHTPLPITSFIIRSIDYLLRTQLGCHEGFADAKIQILDPAIGTGTFIEQTMKLIHSTFEKNNAHLSKEKLNSRWNEFMSKHLLRKLFGFELLMAPYILTHLKLDSLLTETGYQFSIFPRLNIFLTNALDGGVIPNSSGALNKYSREDILASDIKTSDQVSVIIGNPPYSRSSKNTGAFIEHLMDSYKASVRTEKNIQPLSDDYIKFIRLAQDLIERTGWGIIGMITNHTYLMGIIHRGMREELMKAFDHLYFLNLHGSLIIYENHPTGIKDENIFGIKQGVCIAFFLKHPNLEQKKIFYFDLYGTKENKFEWLKSNDVSTISWADISNIIPGAPFTIGSSLTQASEYHQFHSLTEIFEFYNVGGKPGDDKLLVAFTPYELENNIQDFLLKAKKSEPLGKITEAKGKVLRLLEKLSYDKSKMERYNYRPFDIRWTYYDPSFWTRPVRKLKEQCHENTLFLCSRIVKDNEFSHVFVSKLFTDVIFLSNTSSVNCYVFPLLKRNQAGNHSWNLTPLYLQFLEEMGFNNPELDSIAPLAYPYAILFSNKFRKRYDVFLKRDFPRIPFIRDPALFTQLVELGTKLINLHLHPENLDLNPEITTNISDNDKIKKGFPKFKDNRIYIDSDKWLQGINEDDWTFKIGKYHVCKKWLKDRITQKIQKKDIIFYLKILNLIKESIRLIKEIDLIMDLVNWDSISNSRNK